MDKSKLCSICVWLLPKRFKSLFYRVHLYLILLVFIMFVILFKIHNSNEVTVERNTSREPLASFYVELFLSQFPKDLKENLFLMDREVLKLLSEGKHTCLFCHQESVVFGLIFDGKSSEWNGIDDVVTNSEIIGFKSFEFSFDEEYNSSVGSDIVLGILAIPVNSNLILEVVVFHEHKGDFWWHGALQLDRNYKSKLWTLGLSEETNKFQLSREGAFNFIIDKQSVRIDNSSLRIPKDIEGFLNQTTNFIECNHESAARFYEKHPKNKSDEALQFTQDVRNILSNIKNVLDPLGIRFWLSSGTALGYYRQCDTIAYTRDTDIEVFISDYGPDMIEAFVKGGFRILRRLGTPELGLEYSFTDENTYFDLFFNYEESDHFWIPTYYFTRKGNFARRYRYKMPKFELCWTEFLGLKLMVPCNIGKIVELIYGARWTEPITFWGLSASPNRHIIGRWNSKETKKYIKIKPPFNNFEDSETN